MDDRDVSHVELSHIVNDLRNKISGLDNHRSLNEIRSQIDHCLLVVNADLLVLVRHWNVFAPEVSTELLIRQ